MNKSLRILAITLLTFMGLQSYGQRISHGGNSAVVCYAGHQDTPTRVEAPAAFRNRTNARAAATANFEVVYNGFTPEAQAAFQYAVDIWASVITSPVTIRLTATWEPLAQGVLGQAGPAHTQRNFDGAPSINVDYAGALAEKLAGKELNGSDEFDIFASFSSTFNWYLNTSGTPATGQFDFISVVLHEIGHGLGFSDRYNWAAGTGDNSGPIAYDINLENFAGLNLYQNFAAPSTQLGTQLVSNNLFINSQLAVIANGNQRPKIYAPTTWSGGSSIAHLDEAAFPAGDINSLMSPQFAPQEVNHDPGPITLSMFQDMGWETIYIDHEPVASTENTGSGAFDVVATITPDDAPNSAIVPGSIFLHYYTSDDPTVFSVTMTATGNQNEYSAQLPGTGGNELDYYYYISVDDNLDRTRTKPGKIYTALEAPVQGYFTFNVGPDTEAPVITHTPREYLSFLESEIELQAEIVERYDLTLVEVEYSIDGTPQPSVDMTLTESEFDPSTGLTTSFYEITIPFALADGELFSYRIVATDNSSNSNTGADPASDFHHLPFKGIKTTQEAYINNFNEATDDFLTGGINDFSITQPAGFNDPAIHSVHPYIQADDLDLDELNYTYTLRVPILVQGIGATVKFDEIVLVEPGADGTVFGDADFWDYVITEGSLDGGETWTPLADGYDSRDYGPWLTKYNSSPTAVGDPSLFRTRTLNLLDEFNEGDEVMLRFRLFSDPFTAHWGWAIDNLRIQIDDEAPTLLHQHLDYVKSDAASIVIEAEVTDNIAVDKVVMEVMVNEGSPESFELEVGFNAAEVTFTFDDLSGLSAGDKISYRLVASDASGNSNTLPAEGYFEMFFLEFESAVDQYTNNFNSASDDFVGNFFSIDQPSGFSDGAIHSSHDYMIGFGPDPVTDFGPAHTSDFTYTLKKPVTISDRNANIRLDEIVIVEGHANGAVFGTPAFNDYVVIEGSKDGGDTWKEFFSGYDAVGQSIWVNAFNNGSDGTPSMFRTRTFNMTESGDFDANDEVIIRFRLNSNATLNGWGWAIDNLYIQDPITTAVEKELELSLSVYPNPVKENIIVEASGLSSPWFNVQLLNAQGQPLYAGQAELTDGNLSHSIPATTLSKGVYFVKVYNEQGFVTKKVIKID